MDIKPQNILVKKTPGPVPQVCAWQIYLADFGLSRSFAAQWHSQTEGPTSRTPRYCAPEVYHYERRGRSADIFSLGCVLIEIMTVIIGAHPQDFADFRRGEGQDESFHANLSKVTSWTDGLVEPVGMCVLDRYTFVLVKKMIEHDPAARPTASALQVESMAYNSIFHHQSSCLLPPEPYMAYEDPTRCDETHCKGLDFQNDTVILNNV
jgi:serine/threonine protein kinase